MTPVPGHDGGRAKARNPDTVDRSHLQSIARARFDSSIQTTQNFFDSEVGAISSAALDMARRFKRGGRLIVLGEGADATDAQHVSVEFVHPVIVGKRALPAIALTNDAATLTAHRGHAFAMTLKSLARADDIVLAIGDCQRPAMAESLEAAAGIGMLSISIEPDNGASPIASPVAHRFLVPGSDPLIAQEVGESLYHVFWELVHLFLEHDPSEREAVVSADSRVAT